MGRPRDSAKTLTGDLLVFFPLPAGRSGRVYTPTIGAPQSAKPWRVGPAKSGVPMKTQRRYCRCEETLNCHPHGSGVGGIIDGAQGVQQRMLGLSSTPCLVHKTSYDFPQKSVFPFIDNPIRGVCYSLLVGGGPTLFAAPAIEVLMMADRV